MYYKSINDMNDAILRGLEKFPTDADLVVGIPRSGLLAGNMISLYLNLPLTDLKGLGERRLLGNGKRPLPGSSERVFEDARKIIVVDDCVSRGTEMLKTKKLIEEWGYADRVVYASVFCFPERPDIADINLEIIPRPMCFQWSCMHTPEINSNCVDLDGLLAARIAPESAKTKKSYLEQLSIANPIFTPTVEIGCIFAHRPEFSRDVTERWLEQHRIKYKRLILLPDDVYENSNEHTKIADVFSSIFKEEQYRLYLSGDDRVSAEVADQTGKPVMSIRNSSMLNISSDAERDILRGRLRWFMISLRSIPKAILRKLGVLR